MELSIFLAQLMGIYFVIMGLMLFVRQANIMKMYDKFVGDAGLMLYGGAINIILGLGLVLSHNVWTGTYEIVVTVISWIILVKGLILVFLNPKELKAFAKPFLNPGFLMFQAVIILIVGIYLVFQGFNLL